VEFGDFERVVHPGASGLGAAGGSQGVPDRVVPPLADGSVEAVAEADRLGPVIDDDQRPEPRVGGVPGHDGLAAGQQFGGRPHRRRVHRDQLIEARGEVTGVKFADGERAAHPGKLKAAGWPRRPGWT